jgi:hypothetical protein
MPLGASRLNTLSKVLAEAFQGLAGVVLGANATQGEGSEFYQTTSIPGSGSGVAGSDELTLSFWWKDTNNRNTYIHEDVLFRFINGSGKSYLAFNYFRGSTRLLARGENDNTFELDIRHGVDGYFQTQTFGDGTYDDGNWHHYLATFKGSTSTFELYVDGTRITQGSQNATQYLASQKNFGDNVWEGDHYDALVLCAEVVNTGSGQWANEVAQLYLDDGFNDITDANVRAKFYNNGAVDMGTDGTGSGLSQPLVFHNGDTSTFFTNNGTGYGYSMSKQNVNSAGEAFVDVAAADGPQPS